MIAQGLLALDVSRLFPPKLDLSCKPSFSGVEETFGDQYLSREAGCSSIRGPQKNALAATVKHFAGFRTPERVLNTAMGVYGHKREVRRTYLLTSKRSTFDADAGGVMSMTVSLQGQIIVYLPGPVASTNSAATASASAVTNAVTIPHHDIETGDGACNHRAIPRKRSSGTAVSRMLRSKFGIGLFENPLPTAP
ncbi:hypothetical protein B9Z19DRAFT_1128595 [Tuber borchii]|uniref:Glycoside hydrolase family 3 N-terminal domain-containing protein n=1 Tax=Tuber borchii TaxID=42251 RepID=A0A2T6ZP06_TUBBO|nr:hypothetical protein B9Z19DRAFT_1128595 [Tuber borchii]